MGKPLVEGLAPEQAEHLASRLETNLIAWLTTVRPSGLPDTVPVWYLWVDGSIVIYSRPNQLKHRNLAANPKVSVVLDDTRSGDDVIRIEGHARVDDSTLSLVDVPAYVDKYGERILTLGYGSAEAFSADFSSAIVVTPTRIRGWALGVSFG